MRSIITTFVLALCFLAIDTLSAQKISIQGTLKDINGKAVPDNPAQVVTFKIHNAITGGTTIWTKDTTVAVSGGVYSHYIGGNPVLTGQMFTGPRWLSVTVNGTELTPRTELSYSPYALSVATAQGISNNNSSIDIESDGDLRILRNTTENLIIKTDGKVGIGTNSPDNKLDVEGGVAIGSLYSGSHVAPADGVIIQGKLGVGTNNPNDNFNVINSTTSQEFNVDLSSTEPLLQFKSTGTTNWARLGTSGSALAIFTTATNATDKTEGNTDFMISNTGRVGIGTNNPEAPLHIATTTSTLGSASEQDRTYFTVDNAGSLFFNVSGSGDIAVRAEGWYWAESGGFVATSDKRIKNIIGVTNNRSDLKSLNKIQITDYTYIDKVSNSSTTQKKVIAQQVNEVYPTAVKQMKGIIPNVYQIASKVKHTENETEISSTKIHDFTVGDKVKLILQDKGANEVIIKKILDSNTFIIDKIESDNLFIYGKHVDDLLTIDYDALSMLNISATQELYNRIVDLEAENQNLKTENKSLNEKQTNLENRLDKIEGFMKSIKASTSSVD